MKLLFGPTNRLFNWMRNYWKGRYSRNLTAMLIIIVYLLSLALIELGRRGLMPESYIALMPKSHYAAISIAFTFLLYLELIDLVFGLARSVSHSVGKQFEIFSLILLRGSFKAFSDLPEPLQWPASSELGLVAPDYLNALLGVGAGLFLLGLNFIYNRYGRDFSLGFENKNLG